MTAKPKAVVVIAVIAVAIAAVASASLYKYLKGQEQKVEKAVAEAVSTAPVVVAASMLPIGKPVEVSKVKLAEWPMATVPEGAFASAEETAGRLALQTIMPGDPITESKLMPREGPRGIMTYKIPEGHRAMTVGVDQVSGVAGFITPDNMVDVVLTAKPRGYKEPMSKIVLQNIPVLATGQIIEQKDGKPVIVPTVTLDVTPDEAERLATASSEGKLRLLLRRSGDSETSITAGATVTRVVRDAVKPRMDKKPKRKIRIARKPATKVAKATVRRPSLKNVQVEVWRRNEVTTESFKVKKEEQK